MRSWEGYGRVKFPTCRREHGKCDICEQSIKPGETYIRISIPPWEGEPDFDIGYWDDGSLRVSGGFTNTHKWEIHETHEECEKNRAEELREAEMDLEFDEVQDFALNY